MLAANTIDRAWLGQRVVTLVAFDLKGAFNGVNKTSLDTRLQFKGIPAVARRWIASFMSGRQANIGFDDYRTVVQLDNAGLAQGSPLLPILVAFFNVIWSTNLSISTAVHQLSSTIISAERGKNNAKARSARTAIPSSTTTKLLGAVFDHELRWKNHVQQVVTYAPFSEQHSSVLSAFWAVPTSPLDVEAHVLPTHLRLRHRAQNTITRLHTLPRKHPIWALRAQRRRNNVRSRARFPLAEALKTLNLERLHDLEVIDPTPLPPWRTEAFSEIEIEPDREIAMERAEAVQVGPMGRWSVHAAELIGILYAINIINKIALQSRRSTGVRLRSTTILSDSMSALQAIQNPRNKSAQRIIHATLQAARNAKTHGIAVRLQWMPGHCEVPGNDIADQLAK
ncbi:hypothetical protein EYZ11_006387 [Aspergillus tanneri]|uniref:RNase H type-1 domain-containing protein n=1 Tax=Aspergillus tanneri TaxID=1220188 RepID=A0A4S3JI28_9EURO|nr:hypothetical protein EYZ11_006387 [Aspergillus tanneri]